jgi:hypothetical protein
LFSIETDDGVIELILNEQSAVDKYVIQGKNSSSEEIYFTWD